MRTYVPGTWEISRERYMELRAFCRQYPQWKVEAASMLGVSGASMEATPRGSEPGDPTGRAAERREALIGKMNVVEKCAAGVGNGQWYQALMLNVTLGTSWEIIRDLHPEMLKNSQRSSFFRARRIFFNALDREKG